MHLLRYFTFVAVLLGAVAGNAATFNVTTLADTTDGSCNVAQCTLREAIIAANGAAGEDTITFAGSVSGTIQLVGSLPIINTHLSIIGPGANVLAVRGQGTTGNFRVFSLSNAIVSISGLTITNGSAPQYEEGGGIFSNYGTLTVRDCTFSGSTAYQGGGLATRNAQLILSGSTFHNNLATNVGGGLYCNSSPDGTITNCTFSDNTANVHGGGVRIIGGIASMSFCTIASNRADADDIDNGNGQGVGGGITIAASTFTISNTLLAANFRGTANPIPENVAFQGGESSGGPATFTSNGYNLSDDGASGFFTAPGDQINTNPQIGPLTNNGGPTQTRALGNASPAVNAGDPAFNPNTYTPPLTTDQRGSGFDRVRNGRVDIGAYELQAVATSSLSIKDVSVTETNGGSAQAQFTVLLSAPSTQSVTVTAKSASAGSPEATAGIDYSVLSPTTITFNPGQTSKTISVTILGDTLDENDEKFAVNLSGAVNATIADNSGIGIIVDNDESPTVNVSAPNVAEGNSGTKTMTFTLLLSAASARNISVQYQSTNAATFPAISGVDYVAVPLTTVIFNAGQTTKTVNVTINADTLDEDNERVALNLTNPVNATLGTISDGIIVDDDATPSLSIHDVSVSEGNSGTRLMMFTVTLSTPSGRTVSVYAQTGNGGSPAATAGSDFVALAPTQVVFTPGQITRQVSVVITGDTAVELNEKLAVILSGYVNASISDNAGIGTILNDDAAPLPARSGSDGET